MPLSDSVVFLAELFSHFKHRNMETLQNKVISLLYIYAWLTVPYKYKKNVRKVQGVP